MAPQQHLLIFPFFVGHTVRKDFFFDFDFVLVALFLRTLIYYSPRLILNSVFGRFSVRGFRTSLFAYQLCHLVIGD